MGQKIHPTGFRLGYSAKWRSRWLDLKQYTRFILEDKKLRDEIEKRFRKAALSKVEIERFGADINITIWTARPGILIGRGGSGIENLRKKLSQLSKSKLKVEVREVANPELDANVVAYQIVEQIERRIPFRRAVRMALENIKRAGALGGRIVVSGRLNGAEISRREVFSFGSVPLHTLRNLVDYGVATAYANYGTVGVKVWILKKEKASEKSKETKT